MTHRTEDTKEQDSPTLHQITMALQNNNHESVVNMVNLLLQQKKSLHATVCSMKHDVERIKHASHELNTKLNTLQHRRSAAQQISDNEWHELFAIQHSIETSVMNMMSVHHHHNNHHHNSNGHHAPFDRDRDRDINELSQTHTMTVVYDGDEESSLKTEAMSVCTDSKALPDSSEIASKLECGGRIFSLIEKSERKRCSKASVIAFIRDLGVSTSKIEQAYGEYFARNQMYEMTFESRPLGFAVLSDENGCNAIVTSIQNADKLKSTPLRIGSLIYEINGKRVDQRRHDKIAQLLMSTPCPFDVIFKMDARLKPLLATPTPTRPPPPPPAHKLHKLHEHSMISSTSMESQDVLSADTKVMIDWEQIGQLLLDHRYLPTARLINQALDHLETFCVDEDLHEHNIRDELCKAWSVEDDRGMVLWQILHGHLKYSIPERKWFYDLILHRYFKLENMTTVNVYFLLTKLLRDMQVKHVDLVRMKEVLVRGKITGFSFNGAASEIESGDDFVRLFEGMENVDEEIWEKVYAELIAWRVDETLKQEHKNHQRRFKHRGGDGVAGGDNNNNDDDGDDENGAFAVGGHENEVTLFQDLTKLSIRNDIEYSNSEENRAWKRYRHHLKNIFRFFAGYNASMMRRKELRRFLEICDLKAYWSQHLMQEDVLSMDEFMKYLCNEHVNSKVRAIRSHIESRKEWAMLLNALKCLEEIDAEGNKEGLLELYDFQKFGQYFDLNEQETRELFRKIDKREIGKITIDEVFEWFKKQLLHKRKSQRRPHQQQQHRHHRKRRSRKTSSSSGSSFNSSINSQKENSNNNNNNKNGITATMDDDGHECRKSSSTTSQDTDNQYKTPVKIIRKKNKKHVNGNEKQKTNGKCAHQTVLEDSKSDVHVRGHKQEESLTVDVD